MSKKTNGEIERRVNMGLMAKQVNNIHLAIYGKEGDSEGWLTARVNKNRDDIKQIKTIWSTCTVAITVLFNAVIHFWGKR